MNEQSFFNLGVKLAAVTHNQAPENMVALDGFVSTVGNYKEQGYGNLQRMLCKIAADAFDEAGRKNDLTYHVYEKLSHTPEWYPVMDMYSDAAMVAIGKVAAEYEKSLSTESRDVLVKTATGLLPAMLIQGGKSTPDIVKNLAGVGALGGGVAGGLYWLLNRHSNEDEDKAEAIKAKIDYYNRVSNEIKQQLALSAGGPANVGQKVRRVMDRNIL